MKQPVLTGSTVLKRSEEPVAVEVDRTVVMMSVEREKYYSLDGVGGRIWELLAAPRTLDSLCTSLMAEFDVGMDECRADVEEFVINLAEEGLIEVSNESAGPVRPAAAS